MPGRALELVAQFRINDPVRERPAPPHQMPSAVEPQTGVVRVLVGCGLLTLILRRPIFGLPVTVDPVRRLPDRLSAIGEESDEEDCLEVILEVAARTGW